MDIPIPTSIPISSDPLSTTIPISLPSSSTSPLPYATFTPHQFANLIPTKLENGNYLLWRKLITRILQNFDLYSLLDGSEPCPLSTLPSQAPNQAYSLWIYKDRTCTIILHAALSNDVLPFVVGTSTAKQLWDALERRFAAFSRSHLLRLKNELYCIKKGTLTMAEYLEKFKVVSDKLAAAGSPLDDLDLIAHILRGLPVE